MSCNDKSIFSPHFQAHDIIHFLPHDVDKEVKFIWSSEKTGFRHLYCVTSKLQGCDKAVSAMDLIEQNAGTYRSEIYGKFGY